MKIKTLLSSLLLSAACLAGTAAAQMPDTAAGARRAAVCFACHGDNGHAKVPGYPHLAGQDRQYLEQQLRDFRGGQRKGTAMNAMAQPLSDEDIRNIAAHFSKLTP